MAASPTSPFGILSFPHLFVPRAPSPGADERFSVILIFDTVAQSTEQYKELKRAAMAAATEKWGNKAGDMIKNGQVRLPFRDAAEKSTYAGFEEGRIFVNFWTKTKPGVISGNLSDLDAGDVYPGCIGRVTYNAFAYDNSGNKGVSFGLNNVQITDLTTPRLDGRTAAKNDFDQTDMAVADMSGTGSDAGGYNDDDELPF